MFAFPGRANDNKSEGCNYLIAGNKAQLITCATDLVEQMNWGNQDLKFLKKQRELFVELSPAEIVITGLLKGKDSCSIDELYLHSGLSSSNVAEALLMLEMQGVIASLPGKMYKLL